MSSSIRKYGPEELQRFWLDMLDLARNDRPPSVNEANPGALRAFKGDFPWPTGEPETPAGVNLVYAAWKQFLPQMIAKAPKPAAISLRGNAAYAEAINKLKEYRDREFSMREEYRRGLQDAFLRGTGVVRTTRDRKRGLARSKHFPVRSLFLDHNATCLQDAQHVIEEHEVYRWEFARRFSKKLAMKIPVLSPSAESNKDEEGEGKAAPDRTGKPSMMDRVRYYTAWSKHENDWRVYSFHDEWNDDYLYKDDDGAPGEPWPFRYDDEEWHITPVALNTVTESPWGFDYFTAAKGPITFLQFMVSYILAAAKQSCIQAVAYPSELEDFAFKLSESKDHLRFHKYNPEDLQGLKITEAIMPIEFPQLHPAMFQGVEVAEQFHDKITAFNAMAMGSSSSVETAAEATRLSELAEARLADDQMSIEQWVTSVWRKEIQLDGKHLPTRSTVTVSFDEPKQRAEGAAPASAVEGVADEERILSDIPYEIAANLVRGVGDPESAAQMAAGISQLLLNPMAQTNGLQMAVGGQMVNVDPRVLARVTQQVPLDAKVSFIEPGAEAYLGPLAQAWKENLSDWEIRAELDIRVQQGSMRRLGHLQEWNEAMQLFKMLGGFFVEWGMYDKAAHLVNFLINSLEKYDLDTLRVDPQQLTQIGQQMAQQAAQQQQQEQQIEMAKTQQEAAELAFRRDRLEREGETHQNKQQLEREKIKNRAETEQRRDSRDRRRDQMQMMKDQMQQAAQGGI